MTYAEYLLSWFNENKREMPWRNTKDPYKIWVSEVMLQQTQVATVIPYYEKFIERFPTVRALAEATKEEVYVYWQGLGYYRRADNLHKGAAFVCEHYEGNFPLEAVKVKDIPGIGPYTMGAVLSIAFDLPYPAVDGNVMRVLSRQFLIDDDIAVPKVRKIFEEQVMRLMPVQAGDFNQALMELGATICTPKNPSCENCPMQKLCLAYEEGVQDQYPVKTTKSKAEPNYFKAIILKKGEEVLLEKRPDEGLLAKLWGIPLLTENEWDEWKENCYLKVTALEEVQHVFTHRKWMMTPIIVEWTEEIEKSFTEILKVESRFIPLKQMKSYPIATAFTKILKKL